MRALLLGAIALAGAPGVVFGALQATHAYETASRQEAVVRSDDAVRAAVRLEDSLQSARDRTGALVASGMLKAPPKACSLALAAVVATQSQHIGIGAADASGKIFCGAASPGRPDLSGDSWFAQLKSGQETVISGLVGDPFGAGEAIIVARAIRRGDAFDGAAFFSLPQNLFDTALHRVISGEAGAIVLFDKRGGVIAKSVKGVSGADAVTVATAAATNASGVEMQSSLRAERVRAAAGEYTIVSVTPRGRQAEITVRAALIVLAPLLVSAFSIAAIQFTMNRWVLRWFSRMRNAAQDFARGRYSPPAMAGAPAEIAALADAFDAAVTQSRTREQDLGAALAANMGLTRELHHRVKNNLQVLSSLISRQQRRTDEPVVRTALSEARARMTPVALAYRFVNPPEERSIVDVQAYLNELARQLHSVLGGDARGVKLDVSTEAGPLGVDDTTNLGLIVAEAFVHGYAHAAGMGGATASLTCTRTGEGGYAIGIAVMGAQPNGRALDRELIQELARQLRASVQFDALDAISLELPPPPAA